MCKSDHIFQYMTDHTEVTMLFIKSDHILALMSLKELPPQNSNKTGLRIWLRMRIAKMEIIVWSLYGQYMVTFVTIY